MIVFLKDDAIIILINGESSWQLRKQLTVDLKI